MGKKKRSVKKRFFKNRKDAIAEADRRGEHVYQTAKGEYFVGTSLSAMSRLNLKSLLKRQVKKIK